jgi:hypothetical protein
VFSTSLPPYDLFPITCNLLRVTLKTWLEMATQVAERRGAGNLKPLLEALARQTAALRSADWNLDARGDFYPPPAPDGR